MEVLIENGAAVRAIPVGGNHIIPAVLTAKSVRIFLTHSVRLFGKMGNNDAYRNEYQNDAPRDFRVTSKPVIEPSTDHDADE